MVYPSHLNDRGWIFCPWCGSYVVMEKRPDGGKRVAEHPEHGGLTCPGSQRKCATAFGQVLIGERET